MLTIERLKSLAHVKIAGFGRQPNKSTSLKMVLDPDELPGANWRLEVQQTLRAHAFKGNEPAFLRAKDLRLTTARRLFKSDFELRSVMIEITPFANVPDAEARIQNSDTRITKSLKPLTKSFTPQGAESLEFPQIGVVNVFKYDLEIKGKTRKSVAIASAIGKVVMIVTCSGSSNGWPITEAIEVAELQAAKIRMKMPSLSN
jgi:hypothetical protein